MIGAPFIQLLIKKSSSFTGKFDSLIQSQLDNLKIAALERDLKKSKQLCDNVAKKLPLLDLPIDFINRILSSVKQIISTIKRVLQLLKRLLGLINNVPVVPITPVIPVPSVPFAVPPIPTIYPSVGKLMKIVDIKNFANKQIDFLTSILTGLDSFIGIISSKIKEIISKFSVLSTELNSCQIKNSSDPETISQINNTINNILKNIEKEIPKQTYENSYKGFTFNIVEILENKFTSKNVTRRYAVAINSNGIETLKGTPSFATNKQVLINELKFTIDTQNLVG